MQNGAQQRNEYFDLVDRAHKYYGPAVEVGGFNSHDVNKLRKLVAEAEEGQAKKQAEQPLSDAATRLHHTRERVHAAWRSISDGQAVVAKNRRLHQINGAPVECFEEVELPSWQGPALRTVEGYDEANAETSVLANEFETRAHKVTAYVNTWEQSTIEQQNRSLILVLADRLDRMEARNDG